MRKLKYRRDEYRVTLFKKKIREVLGVPWLRFYNSKDWSHLCIMARDFDYRRRGEILPYLMDLLKGAGIEFTPHYWNLGIFNREPGSVEDIYTLNIPVDQDALPERSPRGNRATALKGSSRLIRAHAGSGDGLGREVFE